MTAISGVMHSAQDLDPQPVRSRQWVKGALSKLFTKENLGYMGLGAGASILARGGGAALAASAGAGALASSVLPLTFGAAAAGGVSYYRDYRKRCAEALETGQPKPVFVYSAAKAREEGGFFKGFDVEGLKTAGRKSLFGLAGGAVLASAIEVIPETWVEKFTNAVKAIFMGGLGISPAHAQEAVTEAAPVNAVVEEAVSVEAPLDEATINERVIQAHEAVPSEVAQVTPEQALADFENLPSAEKVGLLLENTDIENETLAYALKGENWAIKDMAHFYAHGVNGFPKDLEMSARLAMVSAGEGHQASVKFLKDLKLVGVDVDSIRERLGADLAETSNVHTGNSELAEALERHAEKIRTAPDVEIRETVETTQTSEAGSPAVDVSVVETAPSVEDQVNSLQGLSARAEGIKQAALNGDTQSLGDMGLGLINERYGFPQNEALGVQLVLQAAEQGNANHKVWAAYLEFYGAEGLPADPNAALEKMRAIDHPEARKFAAAWAGEPLPENNAAVADETPAILSKVIARDATCYVKGTTEAFNLECHNVDTAFVSSSAEIAMVGPGGESLAPIVINGVSAGTTPRDMILSHVKEQIVQGNWTPQYFGLTR